jgi:hypothetical protein
VGIAVKQAPRAQDGFTMFTRKRHNARHSQRKEKRVTRSRKVPGASKG